MNESWHKRLIAREALGSRRVEWAMGSWVVGTFSLFFLEGVASSELAGVFAKVSMYLLVLVFMTQRTMAIGLISKHVPEDRLKELAAKPDRKAARAERRAAARQPDETRYHSE